MIRKLRVPATLAFTLGTATAIGAAASASCNNDGESMCQVTCYPSHIDGGVPPPDGGCPRCADLTSGSPVCPAGCDPLPSFG